MNHNRIEYNFNVEKFMISLSRQKGADFAGHERYLKSPQLLPDGLVSLLLNGLDQLLIALCQLSVEGPQLIQIDPHCLYTVMLSPSLAHLIQFNFIISSQM